MGCRGEWGRVGGGSGGLRLWAARTGRAWGNFDLVEGGCGGGCVSWLGTGLLLGANSWDRFRLIAVVEKVSLK